MEQLLHMLHNVQALALAALCRFWWRVHIPGSVIQAPPLLRALASLASCLFVAAGPLICVSCRDVQPRIMGKLCRPDVACNLAQLRISSALQGIGKDAQVPRLSVP
jgi:hypothetical protein